MPNVPSALVPLMRMAQERNAPNLAAADYGSENGTQVPLAGKVLLSRDVDVTAEQSVRQQVRLDLSHITRISLCRASVFCVP